MCLLRACWIGLAARSFTLMLSHQIIEGCLILSPSSNNKEHSHLNFAAPSDNEQHSDSAKDLETTYYFLEAHEIKVLPRYTQQPAVDLLSFVSTT